MKNTIDLVKIGNEITRRRNNLGLSIKDLSARVWLFTQTITEIESGRHNVTVRQLDLIAQALGMTCQELLAYGVEQGEGEHHG